MNKFLLPVIAALAGAGGFVAYRHFAAPSADAPAMIRPAARMPETLPEFSLEDRTGQLTSIRAWPGKSMIVNFWATWCEPCRREIPLLNEIHATRAQDGFQIVGVAVDFRDAVIRYADEIGIQYPLLIGEQAALEAINAFGVETIGLPFTAFADQEGRLITLHLGELTALEAAVILDAVTRVNAGELTPPRARTVIADGLARLPEPAEAPASIAN